ncbi:insulinase family protein [Neobacillus notoginsengisoli]|uniref:Insulinase family protein n=1 Tax=Neobacillus notoginsengisoli TaxID=1578198 RepID=A0A417YQ48_9BACI|nr:pitrilysin family protein [Neobacillus notoginsengisoli]RHW36376.1 insulinase family protein [Neobacillus notoginsengisoli]
MEILPERTFPMEGFKLHVVKTGKYKTNALVFKMKAPLNEKEATLRALLPHVLQSSSALYPTTTKLRAYLDELYGAVLYAELAKKGDYHIITFFLEIANEKFLTDSSPLLRKGFEFLNEILLNPFTDGNGFDEATVEKEKRTLKQRIQSTYDDKMRYSNFRLIEEMYKGEAYAINVNGRQEDVDGITPAGLYEYYQKALEEDELDLYVIGDVEEEEAKALAGGLFRFQPRKPIYVEKSTSSFKRDEVKVVKEPQDVKQGKLNIGYRTNIFYGDKDYHALQVFNGIFGGFSHSKLFINVREKASLAYYAASRLESHKGLMMVMSGIDLKNYDQAVGIIAEQMDAMKNGDFTEAEMEQTKAVIVNQLLETIDTNRGIVEVLYHNVAAGKEIPFSNWIEGMKKTTREEVVDVAQKISLDTIYFLTGKEAAEHGEN